MRELELLIVGGGPAGLSAALEASKAGIEVVLIDEYSTLGGQFYKQVPDSFLLKNPNAEGEQYVEGVKLIECVKKSQVEFLPNTLVWSIFPDRTLALYRDGRTEEVRANKLILAPGAQEVPVPFPGWTLPGVMMGGAAQSLLVRQRILPGRRVVLAGVGPLQLKVASQLAECGADVLEILEASDHPPVSMENALRSIGHWGKMREGMRYWTAIKKAGIPFRHSHVPVRALGKDQLEAVVIAKVDAEWHVIAGTERTLEADTLCLSYGFLPSLQLTRNIGCKLEFNWTTGGWGTWHDADQQTTVEGVYVAGEVGGIGGADVALEEGLIAGLAAVRALGRAEPNSTAKREKVARKRLVHARKFAELAGAMMQLKPAILDLITDDTIICRCENVSVAQILNAIGAENDFTVRGVKVHTRAGMGPCQGRMCGSVISRLIARKRGVPLETVQMDTPRVPIKPIPLGALAEAK